MSKKLEGHVATARRRRRSSLRPTLAGLTAFSLTCLVLGSIVYAAAIPGLVASSGVVATATQTSGNPAVASQRMISGVLAQMIGAGGAASESADEQEGNEGVSGNVSSTRGSYGGLSSLGALVSGSLHSGDSNLSDAAPDDDSDQGQDGQDQGGQPDDDTSPGQGDVPSGEDGSDSVPEPDPEPDPAPGLTPEQEEELHQALLDQYLNLVDVNNGLLNRTIADRACFTGESPLCLSPDIEARRQAKETHEALYAEIVTGYINMRNLGFQYQDSIWSETFQSVMTVYTNLFRYSEALGYAWTYNIGYGDDPQAGVDEFMQPVREAEGFLTECLEIIDGVQL